MTTIEDIIRIAVNAHDGMKDMVGNPAVAHVLAVGLMGKTVAEQKAGFLHDVVEDSDITIDDLRAEQQEAYWLLWRGFDSLQRPQKDSRRAMMLETVAVGFTQAWSGASPSLESKATSKGNNLREIGFALQTGSLFDCTSSGFYWSKITTAMKN